VVGKRERASGCCGPGIDVESRGQGVRSFLPRPTAELAAFGDGTDGKIRDGQHTLQCQGREARNPTLTRRPVNQVSSAAHLGRRGARSLNDLYRSWPQGRTS
jgi:hypothetical protein